MKKKRRNWAELNTDCLIKVFEMLGSESAGLESLTLDIPFVCKSWYKASLNPQCWKILRFPHALCRDPWVWWEYDGFAQRFMDKYRIQNFSFTGFVKLVVRRSRNSAVTVILPPGCTSEVLELISNECPSLKYLGFPSDLFPFDCELIQELISKCKDLEGLFLGQTHSFQEILIQISLNCKNFSDLSVRGNLGNKEASAIVTLLPKIKYLRLRCTTLPRKSLRMILKGCKELVLLDARNCVGFKAKDKEILKMGSHIKTFMIQGSVVYKSEAGSPCNKNPCLDESDYDDYQ
ncbi:F-box/LRR-repeat protein At3g48880-like [Telopea speciosissima]|uniref:F-box/LRR-repeat protein At3g48880-like n=1 Tax=Telopea speciosissima TaxID=54955 RepID=UPI001CC590E3|nr:F-box/LRR-repeat protein At3g48880-like [Telopea speciosissima]